MSEETNEAVALAPSNGEALDRSNSLRSWLQDARRQAQSRKTIDLPIPRFKGRLWCTFRAIDDGMEMRSISKRHERMGDQDLANLYIAADTLIAACMDTFVLKGEEKISLGLKLGLPLHAYLALTDETGVLLPAENDRQAAFQIFDSTTLLLLTADSYGAFMQDAGNEADGEIEGNSPAPS